jgi:small subunit ribosomal protein S6
LKRYEGMFLFDSAVARDWQTVEHEVHRLCNRINAELLVCVKFDERKLAYEINRRKRGLYVLTYFEAAPERIVDLERDAQLSDSVLRLLVLRADEVTEERLAELKTWPAETPLSPLSSDRRHDDHDRGGFREGRSERSAPRDADRAPAEVGAVTGAPNVNSSPDAGPSPNPPPVI